jgi:xanthine dehydrogenase accessory factor
MTASLVKSLRDFLGSAPRTAMVEVARAKGSTPREAGAYMLVSRSAIHGTIGGGQLEFMAIDQARQMLADAKGLHELMLDIPLGPEIGQCCGGRVEVRIRLVDAALETELIRAAEAEDAHLPNVYIFGGGHVGHALASALALLPVHGVVVETRAEALEGMPEAVEKRLTPVPDFRRLVSPIGGDAVKDKRPAVIAALAAAEIMTALATASAAATPPEQTGLRLLNG